MFGNITKHQKRQRHHGKLFPVLLSATLVVSCAMILPLSSAKAYDGCEQPKDACIVKANYDGCEKPNDPCICENTGLHGYCATGPLKKGLYCHCRD